MEPELPITPPAVWTGHSKRNATCPAAGGAGWYCLVLLEAPARAEELQWLFSCWVVSNLVDFLERKGVSSISIETLFLPAER